jgi:hypothetical protein
MVAPIHDIEARMADSAAKGILLQHYLDPSTARNKTLGERPPLRVA